MDPILLALIAGAYDRFLLGSDMPAGYARDEEGGEQATSSGEEFQGVGPSPYKGSHCSAEAAAIADDAAASEGPALGLQQITGAVLQHNGSAVIGSELNGSAECPQSLSAREHATDYVAGPESWTHLRTLKGSLGESADTAGTNPAAGFKGQWSGSTTKVADAITGLGDCSGLLQASGASEAVSFASQGPAMVAMAGKGGLKEPFVIRHWKKNKFLVGAVDNVVHKLVNPARRSAVHCRTELSFKRKEGLTCALNKKRLKCASVYA